MFQVFEIAHGDEFLLADFGLATRTADILRGFQGTVLYAFAGVFDQYPNHAWTPTVCHDKASLKYTMAALLLGGIPTWDMQPFPQSKKTKEAGHKQKALFESAIKKRDSVVKEVFTGDGVSWDQLNAKLVALSSSSASMKQGAAEVAVASNE